MLSQFSNILPVSTAIAIIKEIEEEYPTWTTVQLIDNLRYVSSLDSKLSQILFGSGDGASFLPKGKLTKVDLDSLIATLTQKTLNKNGLSEVGISVDGSTGRKVALGHAISGISAAIYHYERLIDGQSIELLRGVRFSLPVLKIDGLPPTSINSPTNFEFRPQVVGIDSFGINIRRRLNVMTALYQGGNIEERAKNFAERRYNYLMSNSIKDSEGEPRMPPEKEESMGWWCYGYKDWIQEQIELGLGKNPTKKENIKKYLPKA